MRSTEQLRQHALRIINRRIDEEIEIYYDYLDRCAAAWAEDYFRSLVSILLENGQHSGSSIREQVLDYNRNNRGGPIYEGLYNILKFVLLREKYKHQDPRTILHNIIEES